MGTYLNIIELIISVVLIVVILFQTKGSGFAASFSSDSSIYRTRRGVERTIFHFTIGLAVVFVLISIANVLLAQ